jgi:trans-feruloyl-CoA hydratase/vanillin synthase
MDLKEYFRANHNKPNKRWQWECITNCPKSAIATVHGFCFGGAFVPPGACDLAVAKKESPGSGPGESRLRSQR